MTINKHVYDVVVIGGGSGGLVSASFLARLGLKVLLIDKSRALGGDCLHYGSIPSKKLVSLAKIIKNYRQAKKYINEDIGFNQDDDLDVNINFKKIVEDVNNTIRKVQRHESLELFKEYGCDIILQEAQFIGTNTIAVGNKIVIGKKFIIATGSSPYIPNIEGIDKASYFTNENILDLKKIPKQMVIIGAGSIGIEYAQIFARLGSKVIVIETLDRILSNFDKEQSNALKGILENEGIKFYVNYQTVEIQRVLNRDDKLNTKIKLVSNLTNDTEELLTDCLFIAIGRKPNVNNLGLDNAGVNYSPHGIFVDTRLRTNIKNIYAVGDVTNNPMKFTHVAANQAVILIKNIAFKIPAKIKNNLIPIVIYSDPEIVHIGTTKHLAEHNNIKYKEIKINLSELDRAIIDGDTKGSCKLIIKNKKIIGASILAANASEYLPFLSHLIENKYNVDSLFNIIYPYPTKVEMFQQIVIKSYESVLFNSFTASFVRFLNKYF